MLSQGHSGSSDLQPGLGSTDLDMFHPTGQSPLSDFQKIGPLMLAMKLGWGGERAGKFRRELTVWLGPDPAQMG